MTRRMAELVLCVLFGEGVFLAWRCRRTGQGPPAGELVPVLGAGLFLGLALRAEAMRRPPAQVAGLLALAGGAHGLDLRRRLRGGRA